MSYNSLFGLGGHAEDANLEGWWPLQDDAASTAVADQSSNGNHGTLNGGSNTADISITGPNSYLSKALDFAGTHFARIPDDPSLDVTSEFSLIGWGNRPSSQRQFAAKYQTGSDDRSYETKYSDTGMTLVVTTDGTSGTASSVTASVASASAGNWSLLGFRLSGGNFDPIADGGNTTTPVAQSTPYQGAAPLDLGAGPNGSAENIKLSGMSLFSRFVSDAEFNQVYLGPEPAKTGSDTLSGTAQEGETLTASGATYALPAPFASGTNGTIIYSYQWTRSDDDTGTNETNISGATSADYTLVSADVGKFIRRQRRASNDGGFDSLQDAWSDFSAEIQAAGGGVTVPALDEGMLVGGFQTMSGGI